MPTILLTSLLAAACTVPAETQALIDEYNRTIPVCEAGRDCEVKWEAARNWVINTPSYPIRRADEDRIETYDADSTRAGTEIRVTRESLGNNRYRFLIDVDCFAIDGCPPYWETRIDFNRTVGAAGQ